MSIVDWLRSRIGGLSARDQELASRLEKGEALRSQGSHEEALRALGTEMPEAPDLLARWLHLKVRVALDLRDLLCLEGMALHAETLGELLPEPARYLMLEAEAVGALHLAKSIAQGISAAGVGAGEDLVRIQAKKVRRIVDDGYLTIAQTTLGAHFEDIRLVGWGRTSYVVSCRGRDGGGRVAVKFLGPKAYLDERGRRRFQREFEALQALDHPNVLQVYDVHLAEPPYMVTEFFAGSDLRKLVEQGRTFFIKESLRIGVALCSAVAHAHSKDVIHRNIQPSNVLMNYSNDVKLIDFGMARLSQESDVSADGLVMGEWEYLSPEQFAGCPDGPTREMDIFGLGATLYYVLTGRPPYSRGKGLQRQRNPDVDELNPGISDGLREAVQRALNEDPMERWGGAEEMLEALRADL